MNWSNSSRAASRLLPLLALALWLPGLALALWLPGLALAQSGGEKESSGGGGSSLGDLLNKVKDIKVPDSVSNLPNQLTELKNAYLETAQTVEDLRMEVSALREEVEALKSENAELRDAVGDKVATDSRSDLLKPVEMSATELVQAYRDDREGAAKQFNRRYLRVVGMIEGFETGTQEIVVILRSEADTRVRCHVKRDANFHAEVLASQDRVISRNDRSTLLTAGQPVAVIGTCEGMGLDLKLSNCRIEGVNARKTE